MSIMSKMTAARLSRPGGEFELVQLPIPEPQSGQVRVKVEACGICHGDALVKEGRWPGIKYPRVPGHEIAGHIDKVGEGVTQWQVGKRVGVGWHGGHCFQCLPCRSGDFSNCERALITGIHYDGGYAEYAVVPVEALASIPDELNSMEAAPLLCAGVTTYNALRNSGARGGDVVAVQGVGGLGHLAIQFSSKLGYHTVAISSSSDKEKLAFDLGARAYINTDSEDAAEVLTRMGGARVVLATAPNSKAISAVVDGLGINGTLLVVAGADAPIEVSPLQLLRGRRAVRGWTSGHATDSEDTLNFSVLTGIRPQIETFPLENVAQAYQRMITNQARFRVVLLMP